MAIGVGLEAVMGAFERLDSYVIAFWLGLPLEIRLAVLSVVGACAGALANGVLFACANTAGLSNPWARAPGSPADAGDQPRGAFDRVPIVGWLSLRRRDAGRGRRVWIRPLLMELVGATALPLVYWLEVNTRGLFPEAIDLWIRLPISVRYTLLLIFGVISGAFANYLIYTQAHFVRPIGPWAAADKSGPARKWSDRIPIVGWLGLRREAELHGRGFWIRPVFIESALAALFPALYWFETQAGGLLPLVARAAGNIAAYEPVATQIFFGQAILLVLMTAATFIDFDEKTIPDIITIPGTVIALVIGAITISGFMPTSLPVGGIAAFVIPTTFNLPWSVAAPKWFAAVGLWTALAIWSGWCFSLTDRRFSAVMLRRRGLRRTTEFFFAALVHHWTWKLLASLWAAGAIFVSVIWCVGGDPWLGLLSALVGLAVGGGTIWAIRIVASAAMGVEAMGFGDVTLMAMIGAFIGWQGAVTAMFLSPFAAIAIVLVQYVITRDGRVPFGPYLCAGACLSILFWDGVYNSYLAFNLLMLGPMLLKLSIAMLGLLGVLLLFSRMIKMLIFRGT